MAWFRAGGAGIPSSLKSGMNDVLNKKFGTSTTYPPSDWPSDVNLLGPLPEKTASGAIANFSDGADTVPLKALTFDIEPVQASGTPSPSNPLPISGHTELNGVHTGKNLFDNTATSNTLNGTTFTVNADKSITISGTPSVQTRIYLSRATYTIKVASIWSFGTMKANTRVFCKRVSGGTTSYPSISPSYSASIVGDTFTDILLEINTTYDGSEFTIYPMIEVGSTATTYAPYSAETKKWEFPPFGKNMFDKDAVENDKYLDTTTGLPVTAINYVVSDYIAVKKNVSVYIPNTWTARRWFYDVNKTPTTYLNTSSAQVYTPPEDGYIRVSILKTQVDLDTFQIELNGVTSYEPYQEAYTGSLNALTGEMESTSKKKMLNSLTWTAVDMGTYTLFVANLSDAVRSGVLELFGMCSTYKVMPDESTWTDKTCQFQLGGIYDSSKVIIRDDDYSSSTGEQFKEVVQGYIVYELATPTEITLDSVNWQTKLGDNNFYCDTGDTECEYRADIALALNQ